MTRPRRSFGKVKALPSGRFHASYVDPDDDTRRVNAPETFPTRQKAASWLAGVQTDMDRGNYRDPYLGSQPLHEFAEPFLDDLCPRKAPQTASGYRRQWRLRIEPAFGNRAMRSIKPTDVRRWINTMAEGLSPSQVRQAFRLLSQILDAAVEDGMIVTNPAKALPRGALPRMPEPEPRILTAVDASALRAGMKDDRARLMFDVLWLTGVRIGEVLALRRRSVDPLRKVLHVTEAVSEVTSEDEGTELIVGDTKTHQQRRVTLPGGLLADLVAYLETLPTDPNTWLFPSRTGTPMRYGSFRRWTWDPAAIKARLAIPHPDQPVHVPVPGEDPDEPTRWIVTVTPHSLRATHLSLVAAEHGVLEAARRAGHSNSTVTVAHYARPLDGGDRAVADWLDRLSTLPGKAGTGTGD